MTYYKISFPLLTLCLGIVFSMSIPAKGNEAQESREKLNGGYYLLHKVSEDETKLPLLLMVKHTPPDISDYVNRLSQTANESTAALERMQKSDSSLQFDKTPLPLIECDVRESIHDDKEHQLLFGTTGAEFVHALLVSQIEASTYALNLSTVLAQQEKDPDRVKMLQHLSAKWLARRNEAYRLLRH